MKTFFLRRTLLNYINNLNPEEYLKTGHLPEDTPAEILTLFQRFTEAYENHYASRLIEQEVQYTALQNQINPHFLYNTLDCIRSEALVREQDSIAEMTERLSQFFRYCISNRGDFVTLQDEINHLKDYFYIQEYRFGSRFQLIIDPVSETALMSYLPKMTLQPLVENAVHHGLEHLKAGGTIMLRTRTAGKTLYIWIQDDGTGIAPEMLHKLNARLTGTLTAKPEQTSGSGIALPNVNRRIQLYFGQEYGLRINSILNKGTDVEIRLPLIDAYELETRVQKEVHRP